MPISRQVAMIRTAISPRLAMRIFLNMYSPLSPAASLVDAFPGRHASLLALRHSFLNERWSLLYRGEPLYSASFLPVVPVFCKYVGLVVRYSAALVLCAPMLHLAARLVQWYEQDQF